MKIRIVSFLILASVFFLYQCSDTPEPMVGVELEQEEIDPTYLTSLPASEQRVGNANVGKSYLLSGDYVDAGIPLELFLTFIGADDSNVLNRDGINANIPHDYNAFTAANGVEVVAPNCMQCHSSRINGEFVLGLGNVWGDFTTSQASTGALVDQVVQATYGTNSPEWEAYFPFSQAVQATGDVLVTETVGSNPADKLAAVLASHRDKESLEWSDTGMLNVPEDVVPTDVPAWWLLKKKNAMFFNGVGTGDFARISMASSLLTMKDTTKARVVDNQFKDVIAFINTLEAPTYPLPVNQALVAEGKDLFINNCSGCHGTYDADGSYPNLLVDIDLVKTDEALLTSNFAYTNFTDWYNESWFGQGPHAAQLIPNNGYVAPPLDGIWATAPYLHNGSVPDLESLLHSETRPAIWKKPSNDLDYNHDKVGWNYEVLSEKEDKFSYDTNLYGYSNAGHTFGDHLQSTERNALLEYLKTL